MMLGADESRTPFHTTILGDDHLTAKAEPRGGPLRHLEFDIKGLFDNLPHDLLLKAIRKHVKCNWALLYIERWLTASMEREGEIIERTRGTPQGGVLTP
jgi:retron-type reverse transcriptase